MQQPHPASDGVSMAALVEAAVKSFRSGEPLPRDVALSAALRRSPFLIPYPGGFDVFRPSTSGGGGFDLLRGSLGAQVADTVLVSVFGAYAVSSGRPSGPTSAGPSVAALSMLWMEHPVPTSAAQLREMCERMIPIQRKAVEEAKALMDIPRGSMVALGAAMSAWACASMAPSIMSLAAPGLTLTPGGPALPSLVDRVGRLVALASAGEDKGVPADLEGLTWKTSSDFRDAYMRAASVGLPPIVRDGLHMMRGGVMPAVCGSFTDALGLYAPEWAGVVRGGYGTRIAPGCTPTAFKGGDTAAALAYAEVRMTAEGAPWFASEVLSTGIAYTQPVNLGLAASVARWPRIVQAVNGFALLVDGETPHLVFARAEGVSPGLLLFMLWVDRAWEHFEAGPRGANEWRARIRAAVVEAPTAAAGVSRFSPSTRDDGVHRVALRWQQILVAGARVYASLCPGGRLEWHPDASPQ